MSFSEKLVQDMQFLKTANLQRFVDHASDSLAVHAVRFESFATIRRQTLSLDLTLFNGKRFAVLLGIPCAIRDPDHLLVDFPLVADVLGARMIGQVQSEVEGQWRRLKTEQETPFVNGLIDLVDLPHSPLRGQASPVPGVTERDIPGRAPYRNVVRALRAYQFAMTRVAGKRVLDRRELVPVCWK